MQPGRYASIPHRTPEKHSRKSLLFLMLVSAIGTLLYLSAQAQSEILAIEGRVIAADNTAPIRSARRLQLKQLNADIKDIIASEQGTSISVAFHDFVTGKTLYFGSNDSFVAASVPKLLTASLWLHEVDQGKRSLNDRVGNSTAKEQLRLLIEISDNAAWELLDAQLGKKALEDYSKEIGMQKYDFDSNALAAKDVLILLQKLYSGSLLKSDSRQQLIGWMERANYRQYIVSVVPDDAKVYHKVGFLGDRVLDTAIVENQRLSYALVIFTENDGAFDLASAGSTVREIADLVQSRYER